MNYTGAGNIDGIARAAIGADLLGLLTADALPVAVVLRNASSTAYNPATGVATVTETTDTITGYQSPETLAQKDVPGWEAGDRIVAVLAADVTAAPTTATRITVAGSAWRVVTVSTDALGLHHKLHLRRAG